MLEDAPAMDKLFAKVEAFDNMSVEHLAYSKIGKVVRRVAIADPPPAGDEEYRFKTTVQDTDRQVDFNHIKFECPCTGLDAGRNPRLKAEKLLMHPMKHIYLASGGISNDDTTRFASLHSHIIKTAALGFLAEATMKQLRKVKSVRGVDLPTDLSTLRDASVAWVEKALDEISSTPNVMLQVRQIEGSSGEMLIKHCSQKAKHTATEREEESPGFVLSLGEGIKSDHGLEGQEFNDDTAVPTADLVELHLHGHAIAGIEEEAGCVELALTGVEDEVTANSDATDGWVVENIDAAVKDTREPDAGIESDEVRHMSTGGEEQTDESEGETEEIADSRGDGVTEAQLDAFRALFNTPNFHQPFSNPSFGYIV
ncbi:hypothetical protein FRB99_000609 [Tulasnella sp. 403]|nr:hypothetical protein FRB99_000609 [Tulasnella sp. 403]